MKKFNKVEKKTSPAAKEAFHTSCTFPNLDEGALIELSEIINDLFKDFNLLGASTDVDDRDFRTYFLATSIIKI